jgi:phage recombination protein Bet
MSRGITEGENMGTEIVKQNEVALPKPSILLAMATRYGMSGERFLETLKGTVMKPDSKGRVPTNEETAAFLLVAKEYDLNPFTRQIFAFPDKRAGIIPVVSIDGWLKLMNEHPQFDGFDIKFADTEDKLPESKHCPVWAEITIYRKDMSHPITVREYLDEVYQPKRGDYVGPWQTHTKRMLRHKTIIQGARVAFGFSGIYDEDEAQRIAEAHEAEVVGVATTIEMPKRLSETKVEPVAPEPIQEYETVIEDLPQMISEDQRKRLFAIAGKGGKTHEDIKIYLYDKYGIESTKDIPVDIYDEICAWAEQEETPNLDAIIKTVGMVKTVSALNKLRPFLDKYDGEDKVKLMRAMDEKEVAMKGAK